MNHALRAGAAVAGIAFLASSGGLVAGAQDGPICARPNVPASAIRTAKPDSSMMRQDVTGTVQVVVSLDPESRVVGTRIQSSSNALLNSTALTAARQSAFQTEIRNCVPMASDFVLTMQFDGVVGTVTTAARSDDRRPIAVISAVGVASRPPDVASVSAGILTNDDVASVAAAKNVAIYTALRANLKALGIDDGAIRNAYVALSFVPRPSPAPSPAPTALPYRVTAPALLYGYVAKHEVAVTLADVSQAGPAVNAMLAAGVTSISSVLFSLRDRRAAYGEALAAALKDAAGQADAVAAASRMHVAGIRQIQVGDNLLGPSTPAPYRPMLPANSPVATSLGNLHPLPVEVRANVTVTYILKP